MNCVVMARQSGWQCATWREGSINDWFWYRVRAPSSWATFPFKRHTAAIVLASFRRWWRLNETIDAASVMAGPGKTLFYSPKG